MGKPADPAHREKVVELLLHDARFMDTIPGWATGDRVSIASVDAEFIIQDRAADADGNEGIPVILDNGCEAGTKGGRKVVGKADGFVKFSLVFGSVPGDAVVPRDGEVKWVGRLAEDGGSAVRREEVQILVHVVRCWVGKGVAVGRFGSPNFGWYVDDEGESGGWGPYDGRRRGHRAY